MADNYLLREALGQLASGTSREKLIGVTRQLLQGDLMLVAQGDYLDQFVHASNPPYGSIQTEGRRLLAAYSTEETFSAARAREVDSRNVYSVTQPAGIVLAHVLAKGFDGIVIDNASAPLTVTIPADVIRSMLAEADPNFTIKTLLAAPRDATTVASVVEALLTTTTWAAGRKLPEGGVAIAQGQIPDKTGSYLLLFSHPWEVSLLGTEDRPLVFAPNDLAQNLAEDPEIAGVLIDPAGPSIVIERAALRRVAELAD